MLLEGFEPAIPVSKRPQIHALDRTAPGTGALYSYSDKFQDSESENPE
jgi:hypothetical protein